MIRSGNPALRPNTFQVLENTGKSTSGNNFSAESMTLQGTVEKSIILLLITVVAATFAWNFLPATTVFVYGSFFLGLALCVLISVKKHLGTTLAGPYAITEGVFLGIVTRVFEFSYPGIAVQAVGLTMAVFVALLFAYQTKLIRPTENFKLGVAAATGGIAIFYLVGFVAKLVGFDYLWNMHSVANTSLFSIGISVFVVAIAALNLVMDFDYIEDGASSGAPKYMEWYAAFGLLVTLVWLYIEILRLLVKLRSSD